MGFLIFGVVVFVIAIGLLVFCGGQKSNNPGGECPFDYDDFGCQAESPLYEHCWGKQDDQSVRHKK